MTQKRVSTRSFYAPVRPSGSETAAIDKVSMTPPVAATAVAANMAAFNHHGP